MTPTGTMIPTVDALSAGTKMNSTSISSSGASARRKFLETNTTARPPNSAGKIYENVAFAMRVTNISTKKIRDRVPFALSLVGLEDKMDRLPDELSGGEQQRVAVARALAHGPKLIIADEPTGNIDPEMSMDIMQLFEAINKVNITVVVVTHEHELVHKLARKYGNRVITLANGMVASDTAHPEAARRYAAAMAEREADEYDDYDED